MAYTKVPWFQRRVFNPLAMRTGMFGTRTLATRGRRTGRELLVPVVPLDYTGARYLVSVRGEADWVQNLRAAGGAGELRGKSRVEHIRATEVPVEERPPIIDAYRQMAGRGVAGYWKKLPDPVDHPVFRIEPVA